MIANLNPYPNMRSSGVPWVGDFPIHWRLTPNRAMLSRRKVLVGKAFNEYTLLSLTKEGVIVRDISTARGKFSADMGTCQEVRRGDLVFCLFDVPETPRTVGLSPHDGMITGAYTVFECDDPVLARFLEAFYIAMDDRKLLRPLYSGLRNTIPPLRFLGTKTPVPTHVEQHAIVRFLDHADLRIRRYIRAKERQLELLEEQKRAIIHWAVTGRIDVRTGQPYPVYKDSSVEWLGKVPQHWEVSALRFRYEQCLGKMLDAKRIVGEHLVPYLRNVDVQWDEINSSDLPRMDIYPHEIARYTLRSGDLLVCEGGDIGRSAIWQEEIKPCGFQKALHRLRPWKNDRDRPRFLSYALRVAVTRGAFNDGHESTIGHLTGEKLRSHRFAFPPAEEQRSVETFLQNNQRKFAALQNARMKSIDLLKEYRTRLIADVVTGKLDVRAANAGLPEIDPLRAEDDPDDDGTEVNRP